MPANSQFKQKKSSKTKSQDQKVWQTKLRCTMQPAITAQTSV
jgi:hypothetical protein